MHISAERGTRSAERPHFAYASLTRIDFCLWFPLAFPRQVAKNLIIQFEFTRTSFRPLIDFGFWMKYEAKSPRQKEFTGRK